MALILSCLVEDSAQARTIIERLRSDGWSPDDIAVLHPGDRLAPQRTSDEAQSAPPAAVVGGGSAAVAGGAFGWLVGYGVLALPAALIGAAIGTAAGAAVGSAGDEDATLRDTLVRYYLPHIADGHEGTSTSVALLVRAQDAHGYDVVMRAFRAARGKDIQVVGKGRMEPVAEHRDTVT